MIKALIKSIQLLFQSTPSVGRATMYLKFYRMTENISIHALRGEGDRALTANPHQTDISIHALRGEGDDNRDKDRKSCQRISIHALRGEGDGHS